MNTRGIESAAFGLVAGAPTTQEVAERASVEEGSCQDDHATPADI